MNDALVQVRTPMPANLDFLAAGDFDLAGPSEKPVALHRTGTLVLGARVCA